MNYLIQTFCVLNLASLMIVMIIYGFQDAVADLRAYLQTRARAQDARRHGNRPHPANTARVMKPGYHMSR